MGKIEKMRQAIVHVSEKNKAPAGQRISAIEEKWSGILERLGAFNERVKQQMKRDEVSRIPSNSLSTHTISSKRDNSIA